jgi:hypothetical protein
MTMPTSRSTCTGGRHDDDLPHGSRMIRQRAETADTMTRLLDPMDDPIVAPFRRRGRRTDPDRISFPRARNAARRSVPRVQADFP